MVGQLVLVQSIGVRFPIPEPKLYTNEAIGASFLFRQLKQGDEKPVLRIMSVANNP